MARRTRPWEWRRALWSRPGEAVPEKTIIVSATTLAFGLVLLLGALFLGAAVNLGGLDPRSWVALFAIVFILIGVFGIRTGIRQHRFAGRVQGRRRNSRTR